MTWLREIDRWFIESVLPHRPRHLEYAERLAGDRAEADDIVQEAYARLIALSDWRRLENPHAFAMRTVHNIAVERFRRADVVRIRQAVHLDWLDPADDSPSPERAMGARRELEQVAIALESLPERCRDVVKLRRIEGHSPGEIAEKLGISVSTVEKHLAKGLRLLTERLAAVRLVRESEPLTPWTRPKKDRTGS
jgi:RNA polymerase sigma-70 factor (ECF subfamily)